MTGKDMFDAVRYLDDKFIEQAEFGSFSAEAFRKEDRRRPGIRKAFQLAAVIALVSLLVGCGIVYVLKMQNLKLGDQQVDRDRWVQESSTIVSETVPRQVLTISGLKGSPSYQAAQEWYDFQQEYDPDHHIINSIWGNIPEFPEEYDFYSPYSQEMVDKIDKICAKYGLKLMGAPLKAQTSDAMLEYLGIESVLLPDAPAEALSPGASYYAAGYFRSGFDIRMDPGEDAWPYHSLVDYIYSPKDCFNADQFHLDGEDWQERNYTTASGHQVLILRSPTVWESWVFCDVGEATVTLRIETINQVHTDEKGYPEVIETHMTDDQLNQILDCIQFDLELHPGDPAILEGQKASTSLSQTRNGCTVTVKEVRTDGHRTAVTLGVTAPEGTDLEQYLGDDSFYSGMLGFSGQSFEPLMDIDIHGGGGALNPRPDGDGKNNTVEFFGVIELDAREGMAFPDGCKCNLFLKDLYVQAWDGELAQMQTLWEWEGIWNFDLTIQAGDWREMEFIQEPLTVDAITGWGMNGEDVWGEVTITSLKMRTFGGEITFTEEENGEICDYRNGKYPTLVLKDGTTIRLIDNMTPYDEYRDRPIPLDEIDHLLLIDGTKLYPH